MTVMIIMILMAMPPHSSVVIVTKIRDALIFFLLLERDRERDSASRVIFVFRLHLDWHHSNMSIQRVCYASRMGVREERAKRMFVVAITRLAPLQKYTTIWPKTLPRHLS